MAFFGLIRNPRQERTGFTLYATAVAAARDPFYYTELGVPDTLDGRFDLVGLHAFLLIRRLRAANTRQTRGIGQAVFDAMFSDMDINLREIGVGDMSISKRVRAMWEAFHGRAGAYEAALAAADPAALDAALARNVWRCDHAPGAATLAHIVRAQDRHLAALPLPPLLAGAAAFLPVAQAVQ